jgi:hypothetical protein
MFVDSNQDFSHVLFFCIVDLAKLSRRSARLNSKGRTSTDGGDEEPEPKQPVVKRSRKSRENGKDETDGELKFCPVF